MIKASLPTQPTEREDILTRLTKIADEAQKANEKQRQRSIERDKRSILRRIIGPMAQL